jgi:hypothetical protein
MKVIVFGAGTYGKKYVEDCPPDVEIVAICDNNWEKLEGGKTMFGHKIISPETIPQLEFDKVIIAVNEHTQNGVKHITQIREQLLYWLPIECLVLMSEDRGNDMKVEYPRIEFLRNLANDFYEYSMDGAVAECGVCYGDFAYKINTFFPDKMCYLFDTFSSFDDRDFAQETGNFTEAINARDSLATANPDMVFLKMPHKKSIIIKQGYIPETFTGLDNEHFCFVNLDMDLYAPTLASLRFFANKMVKGGIILVHDYYLHTLDGVKRAVLEFEKEQNFVKVPIGDNRSVAIIMGGKNE